MCTIALGIISIIMCCFVGPLKRYEFELKSRKELANETAKLSASTNAEQADGHVQHIANYGASSETHVDLPPHQDEHAIGSSAVPVVTIVSYQQSDSQSTAIAMQS